MDIAEKLVKYTSELSYNDLDSTTIESTKLRLIDSLACAIAALSEPAINTMTTFLTSRPGDEAAFIGGGSGSLESAAFVNGSLIRFVDWNDTFHASNSGGHPSDNFGVILAVGNKINASGKEIILASVLAYEIQCRLIMSASLRESGVDHVTNGLVSSTLAAGKLMDIPSKELYHAVNIALAGHVSLRQLRRGRISDFKGMAFGNSSRNAIFALLLADQGIDGPPRIFEGEFGLNNLINEDFSIDLNLFGEKNGEFMINNTNLKKYPVFGHGQTVIECASKISTRDDFEVEEITEVNCETYGQAFDVLDEEKWNPETRGAADHSLPFCVGHTLVNQGVSLSDFQQKPIVTDEVAKVIEKISFSENKSYTEEYGQKYPHRIEVITSNGTFTEKMDYPKGNVNNPFSKEEVEEKFKEQYKSVQGSSPDSLLTWLWEVERHKDINKIFDSINRPNRERSC